MSEPLGGHILNPDLDHMRKNVTPLLNLRGTREERHRKGCHRGKRLHRPNSPHTKKEGMENNNYTNKLTNKTKQKQKQKQKIRLNRRYIIGTSITNTCLPPFATFRMSLGNVYHISRKCTTCHESHLRCGAHNDTCTGERSASESPKTLNLPQCCHKCAETAGRRKIIRKKRVIGFH